jgi:hypothetical protein
MKNSTVVADNKFTIVPEISRSDWRQHNNYVARSGLLRAHNSFRQISTYLIDKAEGADALSVGNLIFLFLQWKQAMKNHEAYEERKLYPYLAQKHGVSFESLEQQHEELGMQERSVIAKWGEGDTAGVRAALIAHDDVLISHLREEEDLVIPMILSLSNEEYRDKV